MLGKCVSIDNSATFSRQQRSPEIDREKGSAMPAYRWDETPPKSSWEETVDPTAHWERRLQEARANDRGAR